jgi:hypothetical protein
MLRIGTGKHDEEQQENRIFSNNLILAEFSKVALYNRKGTLCEGV